MFVCPYPITDAQVDASAMPVVVDVAPSGFQMPYYYYMVDYSQCNMQQATALSEASTADAVNDMVLAHDAEVDELAFQMTSESSQMPTDFKRTRRQRGKRGSGNGPRQTEGLGVDHPQKQIMQSEAHCSRVIAQLESAEQRESVMQWILPSLKDWACSKHGTRVAQAAIAAGNKDTHVEMTKVLRGSITEMYKSPHANHVVSRLIEVLPADLAGFVLAELEGKATTVAKHQYGCRVLERLIEYCPPEPLEGMIDHLLEDPEPLCRHQYSNFVMQHIFEHGAQQWKDTLAQKMVGREAGQISKIAMHRTASHVVQAAILHGGETVHDVIIPALLEGTGDSSIVKVACERWGTFVIEELSRVSVYRERIKDRLKEELAELLSSGEFGKMSAVTFGLLPSAP